jgi:phospholipase C
MSRRQFLALSAGAAALGLHGCGSSGAACVIGENGLRCAIPRPESAPFDTVVVLMMENRSFDHLLVVPAPFTGANCPRPTA